MAERDRAFLWHGTGPGTMLRVMRVTPDAAGASREMTEDGDAPFLRIEGDAALGILLLCDHATSRIPSGYDNLGLAETELARHIAYDIGAAAVTRGLAARLGAPALLSNFGRLFIDPNRGEDDPTLIMRLSDGAVVPGNSHVDPVERERRIRLFHAPYHAAIDAEIDRILAAGIVPILVSIHSFTPVWRGWKRPWEVGILWDRDPRIALPLVEALAADPALTVGDNEPYSGALLNDALYRHGTRRGIAHALIEIRQDLIGDDHGAAEWAGRLASILSDLNRLEGVHEIRHFGSKTGQVSPI